MRRSWRSMMVMLAVLAPRLMAQEVQFPDTPQGKLAAGFFAAANATDEEAMLRFQQANFSEAALKRRSPEERLARTRQLREQAGALTLREVVSSSATQLVVLASGSALPEGLKLTVTFGFTGGDQLKIDTVQIESQ